MTGKPVIGKDAAQIRVAGKQNAVKIKSLALEPVGAGEQIDKAGDRRRLVGPDLDANPMVQGQGLQMDDHIKPHIARRIVDAANIDEIVELANDAIDYVSSYAKQDKGGKTYTEKTTHFYAYHVLMPSSNALLVNLLAGNLPACFRELRFLIETLAKCYLADLHHPDFSFFEKRLYFLQHPEGRKKRVPETDLIKEFAEKSGTGDRAIKLWKTLSEETHAKKFVERVVNNVTNYKNIPAYALIIPMVFRATDKQIGRAHV